jgi:hypothetical protein
LRQQRAANAGACPGIGRDGEPSTTGDRAWKTTLTLAFFCILLPATPGCSGQSSFLTGGPTVGQLKTSVSHLEFENQQLKHSLAKLERENRSIEDRLVQEQIDNGDLAARLDDARNLLADRGVDPDVRVGSRRGGEGRGDPFAEGAGSAPRTLRAGRRTRERRKPPFAHITGSLDTVPSLDDREAAPRSEDDAREREASHRKSRFDGDLDHHSFVTDSLGWLPVADGTQSGARERR